MASTYTSNLGIEKPGTGEQTGTWGGTVNTDFDLFDQAIGGNTSISLSAAGSSGSPTDFTVVDATSSDARNLYIEFDDVGTGDLGADVYVRYAPDTSEKVAYIKNSLSGSQDLYLFQGTYNSLRDFVLTAGQTAVLKFSGDGASSSTVTSALGDLQIDGYLQVDNLNFNGNTISSTAGTDLNITPLAGQQIVLDATIIVDAGVVTGATSITSTAFVGDLTGTADAVEGTGVLSTGEAAGTKFLREDGDGTCSWQATAGAPEGTAVLSTGEAGGTKFLREDGDNTCSWQTVAAGAPEGTAVLSTGEGGGTKFLREDGDNTCSWQTVIADLDDKVIVCNNLLTTQDTFYLGVNNSNVVRPAVVFDDAGGVQDCIYYDRSTDKFLMVIADTIRLSVSASETTLSDDLSIRDEIFNWASNQIVRWSSGNAAGVGANINLHGSIETDAYDVEFKSDSTTELQFDASANLWDFQANDVVTTGVIKPGGTAGPTWETGSGDPDGVVAAAVGSLFTRTDGSTNTTLYVKETGTTTSSGWVAK